MNRLVVLTVCCLALVGCGDVPEDDRLFTIGAFQMVPIEPADQVREGFVQGLRDAGYEDGVNIRLVFKNAQGEMPNTQLIARNFVADQVDMIFAIGTPCLQAAVEAAPESTKIVFAFVSNPWGAGACTSFEEHLPHVVGIVNTSPLKAEIDLIVEILPDARRLGLIYNPGEPNSAFEADIFKEEAAAAGFEVVEQAVAGAAEVLQAAEVVISQDIDAFAMVGDYATQTGMESVVKVAGDHDVPVFSVSSADAERGAVAGIGWDFYDEGLEAAQLALRLMAGEAAAQIPFRYPEKTFLAVNQQAAAACGVTVPDSVTERAQRVIE